MQSGVVPANQTKKQRLIREPVREKECSSWRTRRIHKIGDFHDAGGFYEVPLFFHRKKSLPNSEKHPFFTSRFAHRLFFWFARTTPDDVSVGSDSFL